MKLDLTSDINKEDYYTLDYPKIDRWMIKILWTHFGLLSAYALWVYFFQPALYYPGPLSWGVISLQATLTVIGIAFLASLLPTLLRGKVKNHYYYRLLVTNCLFIFSYLVVFDTGGSIEAHFHFFIVLALLAVYYDWRIGWVGVVVVAAHHGILNFIAPNWVYYYGQNDVSVIAHGLPVAIAAIYLTWIAESGKRSVKMASSTNKELEQKLRQAVPALNDAPTTP